MTIAPVTFVHESNAAPVVYVVDDDSKVCALISRMLQAAGFVGVTFTDPDQCLKQFKNSDDYNAPKVIILDLSLGKTDGVAVLNALAAIKHDSKILLISGKDKSTLYEIEQMGSDRGLAMLPSLTKPFRLDDLTDRLKIELDPPKKPPSNEPGRAQATAAIERAVMNGEVVYLYQPRFDLASGVVRGAEVTLYEHNPSDGLVPLSIANVPPNSPIFHPLSRQLLRTALKDWLQYLSDLRTPIRLFTRLPFPVIAAPGFLTLIRELLVPHTNFPGLVIQVNWQQIDNVKVLREMAAQLKLYGVGLAVGEIGAIYAAITESFLFPFEEFKLNSNFVSNCALNETKLSLCRDAVELAHSVGASVCAEGVMNNDEFNALVAMKCDTAQGHFLRAPAPIEAFRAKLLAPTSAPQAIDAAAEVDPFAWPGSDAK